MNVKTRKWRLHLPHNSDVLTVSLRPAAVMTTNGYVDVGRRARPCSHSCFTFCLIVVKYMRVHNTHVRAPAPCKN